MSTRLSGTVCLCALLCSTAAPAQAIATRGTTPDPSSAAPGAAPRAAPRTVQLGATALGLGRQRLALVVGNGKAGSQVLLPTAERDTQAVAAALRQAGFVVMVREDQGTDALRASLKEYRDRLEPQAMGFVYVTGLSTQADGQTLLLSRDAATAPGVAATLEAPARQGVPLAEVIQALSGPADSPRFLVLDTAYAHPALPAAAAADPAEPRLPPGMMALLAQPPGVHRAPPAAPPTLPVPAPQAPAQRAATPFAQAMAAAIGLRRTTGPEALRAARRTLLVTQPQQQPAWLGGDTDESEELAEVTLADALVPQLPNDVVREGARGVMRRATSGAGAAAAGEQSVAEVLAASSTNAPALATPAAGPGTGAGHLGLDGRAQPTSSRPGALADAASTLGRAAGAATGVAATAATATVAMKAAEASAAVQGAARVTDAAVLAAGQAAAFTSRAPAAPSEAHTALPVSAFAPATTAPNSPPDAAESRTRRTGEQGERPTYQPRSNRFGHAEGDTYTFSVIDTWKGEALGTVTTAIEDVLDNGQLLANGRQLALDDQGRVLRHRTDDGAVVSYSPAQVLWWANPQPGQRRDLAFTETFERPGIGQGEAAWSGSSSVGRARTIELPGGRFAALPIESSGWVKERVGNGSRTSRRFSRTVWYAPALGHPVAIDLEDLDTRGVLLRRERIELLHVQSARSGT